MSAQVNKANIFVLKTDIVSTGFLISLGVLFQEPHGCLQPCRVLSSLYGMFFLHLHTCWASLVVQMVKNPPAMWEAWDRSLGWEDPLEEGMATHSSVLAWRIPWTEEPGSLQSERVGHD